MSLETARVRGVDVHYGARTTGGGKGETANASGFKEYQYNYSNGNVSGATVMLPAFATVWNIISSNVAAGSVSAATAGGTDVSGADGTELASVTLGVGTHELVITGVTDGAVTIIVEERSV